MLVLIFSVFAIRTSWFQTWLAQQASAFLSSEFGTEVSIEKVDIKFVDRVDLTGVYIEDIRKDTFIYTDVIHADISDWGIIQPKIAVSTASLEGGHVHIRKYKGDENLNFQHILDYFATEDEDTSAADFDLTVAKFELKDIHFIYQDQNADTVENGMDFSNIELSHVNGGFSNFFLDGDQFGINLDDLSFVDRSGLGLNKLSGIFSYSPEMIGFLNPKIGINHSYFQGDYIQIETPNGAEDFADFNRNVKINTRLTNSTLYLQDLAYFVPDLWGLHGKIDIHDLETMGAIHGMRINLDLSLLDTTKIQGKFQIPNLSDINSSFFEEELTYFRTSISDVQKSGVENILDQKGRKAYEDAIQQYANANVIELKNGSFVGGLESFVVDGDLFSGIGDVDLGYGLQFTWNKDEELYHYKGPDDSWGHIKANQLDIGVITQNSDLGKVTGFLNVNGKGFDKTSLDISFDGRFSTIFAYGNTYHDLVVKKGHYAKDRFKGIVSLADDNLALEYDGLVDLKKPMYFDFEVRVDSAQLGYVTKAEELFYQKIASKVHVQIWGTDINKIRGNVTIKDFVYKDTSHTLVMDKMTINVRRHPKNDSVVIRSPFFDLDLHGKYDLNDIGHALTEQLSYVINNVVEDQHEHDADHEHYSLILTLKNINPILEFFDEDIEVAPNSVIRSEFEHDSKTFVLDINSHYVNYHGTYVEEIKVENHFDSVKALISYSAEHVQLTDSLAVRHFVLDSRIKDNKFVTMTGWDGVGQTEPALFAMETAVSKELEYLTIFRPSFFFLKGHKYNVERNSSFMYSEDKMVLHDFKISHKDNYVGLEGIISENPDDWLNLRVHNFNLSDLNGIIGETVELGGVLNVKGGVANLYDTPKFNAESDITALTLDGFTVGDIEVYTKWVEEKKSVQASGKLLRDNKTTFGFTGDYYTDRKHDNLDFKAGFNKTDLEFLNAFDDPDLYTNIEGSIDGEINIKGEIDNPIVEGQIEVLESKVKVPMFNIDVGAKGKILLYDGEIIANHLRIFDQEGNMADCQMAVYHFGWSNWNYNVYLDMDNPLLSDKFLAMDTYYKEGDSYYGKAYVSGSVNIEGYDDHTLIRVDVTTREGTSLILPMYGSSELEEASFIIYDEEFFLPDSMKTKIANEELKKVKRYGVTLDMDFHVTKAAEVKIVFDPLLEDQIVSRGEGNIEIDMNDFGDLSMRGEYIIRDGRYEMRVKQIVEEDFVLENGSTVSWSGDMEDADINIVAKFFRVVSLGDIMPPEAAERRKKEDVEGVLRMSNTLMNPELQFDIVAPKTDDLGKKAINEIKANQDELNKQFFALLILKRFLPKYGGAAGGGDAILGLAETQINSVLDGLSDSYAIKAGLTETSTTVGLETQLNDRTTIKTSFGVLSNEDNANGAQLVGDVDIEYRLNDDGTFTMNFFNETNSSSITSQGNYTQGISLHYQETFNTTKQFRMWQKFLNLFRKKQNRVKFDKKNRRSDKWVPIPDDSDTTSTGQIIIK